MNDDVLCGECGQPLDAQERLEAEVERLREALGLTRIYQSAPRPDSKPVFDSRGML